MDEFSYLSVLLSIILGLAVTQLLIGIRGRLLTRARVRDFWPTQVWAASALLVCTQAWWAMFDLRTRHNWDFAGFAVLLAQTIALYLFIGLIYPDFPPNGEIDLRAHYFAQRCHFFTMSIISTLLSLCRDLVLNHALPHPLNLTFHVVFIVFAISGLLIAKEGYHKFLCLIAIPLFGFYIISLFAHLHD